MEAKLCAEGTPDYYHDSPTLQYHVGPYIVDLIASIPLPPD